MNFFTRIRFFQKATVFICLLFFGTMVFVTIGCFSRKSGNTGMDMAKVQQMRYHANVKKNSQIAESP